MIKINRLLLTTWKTRARVLIDYAHSSPSTVIGLAQSIINDIAQIEDQEEREWLEAQQKERQEGEVWL